MVNRENQPEHKGNLELFGDDNATNEACSACDSSALAGEVESA